MTNPNSNETPGYIVTYNSSLRKDITRINYYLFGRTSIIKKNDKEDKYYYPGILENKTFHKLCNGCYFVVEENFPTQVNDDFKPLLNIVPAKIELNR